jgi:signal transduction histidine kinase
MNTPLSFFNWSLRKALATETESFLQARIRIIYTFLLLALLKAVIVISVSIANQQNLQAFRAIVAFVIYLFLTKLLLYVPGRVKTVAHIMLSMGVAILLSNIFIYTHSINLISVQFAFMIIVSSFYTLGTRWGMMYSVIGLTPLLLGLLLQGNANIYLTDTTQELASPGPEIIVVLNFLTIIIAHYLFYRAFLRTISEKEKLAESKSNFLSTMSHELRTPLNSVIGITELLIDDNPQERQKENLKILQLSARDLLSLINNILDFNKIDFDKLVLESVTFNLPEFLKDVSAGLRLKAQEKQLDFILDIDPQLENITVVSDPTRLSQLIYNLAGNAIKFTDKGSIRIRLECVNKTSHHAEVLFSITDTGIGIHPDKHETIFEIFTQAESHITRKYGGTGLGLAIVKQVLAMLDSRLHLESAPGSGAKFSFTIRFNTTDAPAQSKTPVLAEKADFSNLKILVAEDNELNRMLMQKQLDKLHVQCKIVENGSQAFDALVAENYDAIFMDLHMPVMDGYESLKKVRMLFDPVKANTPVIAFTASVTEEQEIQSAGFNGHLYKPVSMSELIGHLEKLAIHK